MARLSTVTQGGRPHIVPVTFAVDEDYIYTAVDAKPKTQAAARGLQRLRNIEANPQVAVLAGHYPQYRGTTRTPLTGPVIAIRVERWTGWAVTPPG